MDSATVRKWFWGLCLVHVLFWTLLPSLLRSNVPFDTIEGIAWGNQWQWGYDKHPPLAAWLSAIVTHLGGSVGWPVYLLAQLAIFITFWAVWRLANKMLTPIQALVSVMLLEGIFYFNSVITIKFNPTTLMSPLWALAILIFYLCLTRQKIWQWLLLGVVTGLCLLTKYESVMLFIPMALTIVGLREGRASFSRAGIYLAGLMFLLVVAPHVWWTLQHGYSETGYAVNSLYQCRLRPLWLNHVYYPVEFSFTQLMAVLPVFIIAVPLFFTRRVKEGLTRFNLWFLFLMGLGPLLATVLLSLATGCYLYAKWATPFFTLIGLMLVSILQPRITAKVFGWLVILVFTVFVLSLSGRYLYIAFGPKYLKLHHQPDAYFPGKAIATEVTKLWHARYQSRLPYIAGSHYLTANISVYSPDHPIPYLQLSRQQSSWINQQQLVAQGAMFAWRIYSASEYDRLLKATMRCPRIKYIDKTTLYFDKMLHPITLRLVRQRFPNSIYLGTKYFPQANEQLPAIAVGLAVLPPENDK